MEEEEEEEGKVKFKGGELFLINFIELSFNSLLIRNIWRVIGLEVTQIEGIQKILMKCINIEYHLIFNEALSVLICSSNKSFSEVFQK